jgi:membrane-bound lytic murein transglycosylase D
VLDRDSQRRETDVPQTARARQIVFLALLIATLPACAGALKTEPRHAPSAAPSGPLIRARPVVGVDEAAGAGRASGFPVDYGRSAVAEEINFLVGQRQSTLERWFERGDWWMPFVHEVLGRYGLPEELFYLAMIESGFVSNALSHAGALGMWQFMPATARETGLRVDDDVDERLDPVRSTEAAARHLRDLYVRFGDWRLAAAAYNAGSGGVGRAMGRAGSSDFWVVSERGPLPAETRRYVPRLMAVTVIGSDRKGHGITPRREGEYFAYDSVRVETPVPLALLARASGVSLETLRRWNPHLVHGITPSPYWLWTPRGTGERVRAAYLAGSFDSGGGYVLYTVRAGDTRASLDAAAGRGRVAELNGEPTTIRAGQRLVLPRSALAPLDRAAAERSARAAAQAGHVVSSGETLSGIARRYNTSVSELQRVNKLDSDRIRVGQRIRVTGQGAPTTAPSAKEHSVQPGETLSGIAARYGVSLRALRETNGLTDENLIRTGQTLSLP